MTEETLQEREARLIKEIQDLQEREDSIQESMDLAKAKTNQAKDPVLKEHYHNAKIDLIERYGKNKYEMQDRAKSLSLIQKELKLNLGLGTTAKEIIKNLQWEEVILESQDQKKAEQDKYKDLADEIEFEESFEPKFK